MKITRLPYEKPRDEANTSAILIGRGFLAIGIPIIFPTSLLAKFFGPGSAIVYVVTMVLIVSSIAGGYMILSGTGLGLHAIYRLTRLKEKWGLAWISLLGLPFALLFIAFWLVAITYRG
jgi:hypothetical protein